MALSFLVLVSLSLLFLGIAVLCCAVFYMYVHIYVITYHRPIHSLPPPPIIIIIIALGFSRVSRSVGQAVGQPARGDVF